MAGAATFAAVGAGLVSSFNAAADFEHAISAVGAVSQATAKELEGLADTGLRIGKETAFSATEAAMAMEVLAANGVSVADIMNGAADAAVALAAAGGTDLVTAADLASTSMAVWGLQAKDMTDVVNRMAGAANVSRFGVEDMALAVSQGGGAAASAGVEFGDFTTAIAAIAPSFSSGSDAGTSFKQFLAGLTPSAAPAKESLRDLGILTEEAGNRFFDAEGNLKSMAEITDILNVATRDLSEEQKAQALETIFGSDAMRTAASLSKLTGEEFAKMDATMRDSDAAAVAAARMDNASGAMEQLKGSIEVIQIQIGQKLTPVVQALALWLADKLPAAFDAVSEAGGRLTDFFKDFVGDIQWAIENGTGFEEKLVPQFGAVTEAIAHVAIFIRDDLLPAFDAIRDRVQPAADAIGAFISSEKESLFKAFALVVGVGLVAAFAALAIAAGSAALGVIAATAPIIAIGVVVGALAFGIVKLVEHWDDITERMPIVGAAMDAVGGVIASIPPLLDRVAAAWREHVQPVLEEGVEKFHNDVFPVLERFGDLIEWVADVVLALLVRSMEYTGGILKEIWDEVAVLFQTTFDIIAQIVETGVELVRDTISVVMALIRGDWEGAWEGIKTLLSNVWENIKELVQVGLDGVQAAISLVWETIKAITQETWDVVLDVITGIWGKVGEVVGVAVESLAGTLGGLKDKASTAFGEMKDAALGKLDDLRLGILSVGQEIINTLGDVFGRAKDWVGTQFSGILGVIKGPINDAIGAINSLIYAWNGLNFTVGGGSFLGKQLPSLSMGTPDLPAIPYLAAGGIVTRPTLAMIGEAGPEAVIPLGKGVGGGSSYTYNITVNALDARSAADAVLQALVQLERRGGITGGVTRALA